MFTAKVFHPRDLTHLISSHIKMRQIYKITFFAIFILTFLITTASAATDYTVRPSLNIGKEPGTSVAGETVTECQPIPAWLAVAIIIFPSMASFPIGVVGSLKGLLYLGLRRINQENALENSNRENLYYFIKENPGIYLRELEKRSAFKRGSLEYHLKILELLHLVAIYKDNNKKRYFANGSTNTEDMALISLIQNKNEKLILSTIYNNENLDNKELAEKTGFAPSTLSRHLNHLKKSGLVVGEIDGNRINYNISESYYGKLSDYITTESV